MTLTFFYLLYHIKTSLSFLFLKEWLLFDSKILSMKSKYVAIKLTSVSIDVESRSPYLAESFSSDFFSVFWKGRK